MNMRNVNWRPHWRSRRCQWRPPGRRRRRRRYHGPPLTLPGALWRLAGLRRQEQVLNNLEPPSREYTRTHAHARERPQTLLAASLPPRARAFIAPANRPLAAMVHTSSSWARRAGGVHCSALLNNRIASACTQRVRGKRNQPPATASPLLAPSRRPWSFAIWPSRSRITPATERGARARAARSASAASGKAPRSPASPARTHGTLSANHPLMGQLAPRTGTRDKSPRVGRSFKVLRYRVQQHRNRLEGIRRQPGSGRCCAR